jgi:hypothetical protein
MDTPDAAGDQAPIQPDPAPATTDAPANLPTPDSQQDDRSFNLAAREAELYESLTGTSPGEQAPSDQPPTATTDDKAQPTGDAEPTKPKDEPPADQPADQADPTEEEMARNPASARRHTRRLLKERRAWIEERTKLQSEVEENGKTIDHLLTVAEESGMTAERIPGAIATFGKAFIKGDKDAMDRVYQGLISKGYKPADAQDIDRDALKSLLDEARDMGLDTSRVLKAAPHGSEPTRQSPVQPAANQSQQSTPTSAAQPPVNNGIAALQATMTTLNQRINAEVGPENAKAIGDRVMAQLRQDFADAKNDPAALAALPRLLKHATDAELRQVAQSRIKPPQAATPSTRSAPPADPLAKREQEWLARNVR